MKQIKGTAEKNNICHLQNKSSNGNITAKALAEHTEKTYDNFTVIIDSKISLKYIVCYLAPVYLTTKVTFFLIFFYFFKNTGVNTDRSSVLRMLFVKRIPIKKRPRLRLRTK